jgi:hypothetical protein
METDIRILEALRLAIKNVVDRTLFAERLLSY